MSSRSRSETVDGVQFDRVRPLRRPGRWVSGVIIALVVIAVIDGFVTNKNFHWPIVGTYLFDPTILRGVEWTLVLTVAAMVLAIVLAITLALMRESDNPLMAWFSRVWVWFFRGTPVYTQLIFWGLVAVLYPRISLAVPFGGPELFGVETRSLYNAALAAILGLGLNESAYLAEIFRSGFSSVDPGQADACKALGMSKSQTWRKVILPQAMRIITPPTGNEAIGLLKTTSLVLAVPFTLELTYATNAIANRLYQPIPLLIVAAAWYLSITSLLMVGQHYLEKHFGKGH